MKYEEFMAGIENFYGSYDTDFKREHVFKYLMDKCPEDKLEMLFAKLTETFSSKYKTPPTNAEIKTILERESNIDEQAQRAWDLANDSIFAHGQYRGVFFEDTRIQAVIKDMGGWDKFCNRHPKNEVWDKKDFIKLFINYSLGWELPSPETLQGINTDGKFQIIGDKDKCLKMLEERKLLGLNNDSAHERQ